MKSILCILLIFSFLLNSINNIAQTKAFRQNQKLGRGINIGNALEAPTEGEWGVTIKEEFFQLIASKGFNSVRIPIRWSAHALESEPYTIDASFFERIDWVIQNALKNKLMIIINCHHYNELFESPSAHKTRFLTLWSQIAHHYSQYSDSVIFEPLNEPNTNLTAELWNEYLLASHDTIRKSNPGRTLLFGIADWGGISALNKLVLPIDTNIILTVHYYNPFTFTHQGAEWVANSDPWLGTGWYNTLSERNTIINELSAVVSYASEHSIPVNVGEFGSYSKGDMDSRVRWTNYCTRFFEQKSFSWNYWEFCAGFGIYDPVNLTWREGLTDALLSMPMSEPFIDPSGNLLFNGYFTYGKTNWANYLNGTASSTFSTTGEKASLVISNGGSLDYSVQLVAFGLIMEKGKKYHVEFDAYANKNININAGIGKNSSPYTSYFWKSMTLSTSNKKFSYEFTMEQTTDSIARFVFNLGLSTGNIFIDNVLVYEVNSTGFDQLKNSFSPKVFPIPAKDYFTIKLNGLKSFIIHNNLGQLIMVKDGINTDKVQVDCKSFPRGLYIMGVYDKQGNFWYDKILIQ